MAGGEVLSNEQRAEIKTILDGLSDFTKVFRYMPVSLDDRELPAVILWPRRSDYTPQYGDPLTTVTRSWEWLVFVKRAESGREFAGEQTAEELLEAVKPDLMALPHNVNVTESGLPRSFTLSVTGDSHVTRLLMNDRPYYGFIVYATTETEYMKG